MADPNGYEFKVNEFACIIFSRRSGEPRAHGPTEQEAWIALVQQKYADRNIATAPEFFEIEMRIKRIDHMAVSCGDHGAFMWTERLPLTTVLAMPG